MHRDGMKLGLLRGVGAAVAMMTMVAAGVVLAGCPADKPASGPGDVLGAGDGGASDDAAPTPSGSATVEGTEQADASP